MRNKFAIKLIFILVGSFTMLIVSFTVIYDFFIPDVCYYHENEMNSFMSLFYSAKGGDNGHPSPNFLNFLVSVLIGGGVGYMFFPIFFKKNHVIKD